MTRKYYAYGTYAENGKLYTKDGKEIKDSKKYYEVCRENKTSTTKDTYTSKGITYKCHFGKSKNW